MVEIQKANLFSQGYNEDSETNWYFTRNGVYEVEFTDSLYNILKFAFHLSWLVQ